MIPLNNIQELVERSIFHTLVDSLVDYGYYPNFRDSATYPNNDGGKQALRQAVDAVINDKGFAIEPFGVGSSQAKGEKATPRIVVRQGQFIPGSIGSDTTAHYTPQPEGGYKESFKHPTTEEYYIAIHLVSSTIKEQRAMNSILNVSIPRMGYLPIYNDQENNFFVDYLGGSNHVDTQKGIDEFVFNYRIPDLRLIEDNVSNEIIASISEIRTDIYLMGDTIDGEKKKSIHGIIVD